ncbi:MAG: hypothetical protein ACHQ52_06285 [Candidatus Eisenbacteria bacterium]
MLVAAALSAGCARRLPAGRLAPETPIQEEIADRAPIGFRGYTLVPLARFHATARVLGAQRYRFDREAALAPVDLALGWGPMSDSEVLSDLSITQMARYYMWSGHPLPLEPDQIVAHSANVHMIPRDDDVRRTLLRVRRDDVVRFAGSLVRAEASDGWSWTSSLSRHDRGGGSCELVLVDSLSVE